METGVRVVQLPCNSEGVVATATDVLEALRLHGNHRTLNTLAGMDELVKLAALNSRVIPTRKEHHDYGLGLPAPVRGVCWVLSKGEGTDDKLVLLLPPFVNDLLDPHWEGPATVVLVGQATVTDAVTLLAIFAKRIRNQ